MSGDLIELAECPTGDGEKGDLRRSAIYEALYIRINGKNIVKNVLPGTKHDKRGEHVHFPVF
jgi:hypothetical protein